MRKTSNIYGALPRLYEGLRRGSLSSFVQCTEYQVTFALESHQNGGLEMATSSTELLRDHGPQAREIA